MKRVARPGIPAAMILAGGMSRHGSSCGCSYCRVAQPAPAERRFTGVLGKVCLTCGEPQSAHSAIGTCPESRQ